jgi:hypothetical protein
MSNVFGWITPSREFVEVEPWGHVEAIGQHECLKRLIDNDLLDFSSLDYIREGCEELIAQGEHPEWHCYEMACDSRRDAIVQALYDAGAVRVGSHGNSLCVEGKPEAITNLHQFCKDFAEDRDMHAVFEPRGKPRRY